MAIFKCKMCGGNIEVTASTSVVTCEYCGTSQTISKSRDEIISNLYNRANDLRIKCEFDRAEQTYEKILEQDNTEAEAHWGVVLCRYGIEYVKDPNTNKRIPTCHRTSFEAITTDADFIATINNADDEQKEIYKQQAREIDEIQKNILEIVKTEKPFDVFICYKETDENGKRTIDSSIANDIYYQLTQEGLKVFYAPITLEDKLGQEYEPYIFAALSSAKIMLVVGTKPEHFNAVWVKNEWSRYLKLIKLDRNKMIIPCYRDMDAYDLPDEFAHLQSQDMSKIGFIQDLIRGVKKVYPVDTVKPLTNHTQDNKEIKAQSKIIKDKKNIFIVFSLVSALFSIVFIVTYVFLRACSFAKLYGLSLASDIDWAYWSYIVFAVISVLFYFIALFSKRRKNKILLIITPILLAIAIVLDFYQL